jgi:SAM-dependent methyltransferase
VCGSWVRRFREYGLNGRLDAQCPVCNALERHRFLWLFLKKRTTFLDGTPGKMLCFALEPCIEHNFQKVANLEYLYADLYDPKAMIKVDIANIQFPDETFDWVYCSHVLEHVENDSKAIGEMYRVLKKGGQAVVVVPILVEKTYEDPSITDPAERERVFGQHDHVRLYGPDFKDRLIATGFIVTDFYVENLLNQKQIEKLGLKYIPSKITPIYLCQKGIV